MGKHRERWTQPDGGGPRTSDPCLRVSPLSTGPPCHLQTEPRVGVWEDRWGGEGHSMSFPVGPLESFEEKPIEAQFHRSPE